MEPTILSAIQQICEEKNLSSEQVLEAIEQALAAAFRKDFGEKNQNIKVKFNPENKGMKVFDVKTVVEDFSDEDSSEEVENEEKKRFNPRTEIQISEANLLLPGDKKKTKNKYKIGDIIKTPLKVPSDFGRIAAQTAKQVITQRLREAEREIIFEKYKKKEGEIVNGRVQRQERYTTFIDIGDTTAILPSHEQILEERYSPDQKIKIFIMSVNKGPKGPEIIVSRRHPEILKELFKIEIPEIANNSVEIKAIAREPGSRSKVAVWTKEKNLDPIGSCVGQRGVRIQTIIAECGGEKIDIIKYSEDSNEFISNALSPAKISSIETNEKEKTALVKVKQDQLSLAIGKSGQNVRLAAKLTGWKINIQEYIEEKVKVKTEEEGGEKDTKKKKVVKKKVDKKKVVKKKVIKKKVVKKKVVKKKKNEN